MLFWETILLSEREENLFPSFLRSALKMVRETSQAAKEEEIWDREYSDCKTYHTDEKLSMRS